MTTISKTISPSHQHLSPANNSYTIKARHPQKLVVSLFLPLTQQTNKQANQVTVSISIFPKIEPQVGAVCKSVVIANLLNQLNALLGLQQPYIYALNGRVRNIFNEKPILQRLSSKAITQSDANTHSIIDDKKTVIAQAQATQRSTQGEILSQELFVEVINRTVAQNWSDQYAQHVSAKFIQFNSLEDFSTQLKSELTKQHAVAVFFNMHFPLSEATLSSINTQTQEECYEHTAVVESIFIENGIEKVKLQHFGTTFTETMAALYRSNCNLSTQRGAESYVKNPLFQHAELKSYIKSYIKSYLSKKRIDDDQSNIEALFNQHLLDTGVEKNCDQSPAACIYNREFIAQTTYENLQKKLLADTEIVNHPMLKELLTQELEVKTTQLNAEVDKTRHFKNHFLSVAVDLKNTNNISSISGISEKAA